MQQKQQKTQKKQPARRCVGCNAQKLKRELVRVVRTPQGQVALDATGKLAGRGAYLCPDAACLARARKAKRLERALEVQIPPELYESLTTQITAAQAALAKEAPPDA